MRGELTEKGEEEHQKHNGNADGLGLGGHAIDDDGWGLRLDGGGDDHAKTHANCADDEKRLAAEAVDGPGGVEREDDAEGGVEGVDEGNLRGTGEDFLVDLGGIGVERALTGNLLTGVDDESEQQTLAHRWILPQRGVARRDGLLLELERLTDHQELVFDVLLRVADAAERGARSINIVALLDVPTRGLGNEPELGEDKDGHQELEDDNHAPVPLAEAGLVLLAGKVDPVPGDMSGLTPCAYGSLILTQ